MERFEGEDEDVREIEKTLLGLESGRARERERESRTRRPCW